MEKLKNCLLPDKEGRDAELTASVFGELGLMASFVGIAVYNLIKGKDNQPLLIVVLGSLAGKGIGRFLETRDKRSLLAGVLNLLSCAIYTAGYVLDSKDE